MAWVCLQIKYFWKSRIMWKIGCKRYSICRIEHFTKWSLFLWASQPRHCFSLLSNEIYICAIFSWVTKQFIFCHGEHLEIFQYKSQITTTKKFAKSWGLHLLLKRIFCISCEGENNFFPVILSSYHYPSMVGPYCSLFLLGLWHCC